MICDGCATRLLGFFPPMRMFTGTRDTAVVRSTLWECASPHRLSLLCMAGLAALVAGEAEAKSALPPPELREILGYGDYEAKAKTFIAKA